MKNKNKTIFRNELNLALDGTVSTGLLLVAQSGATAFLLNSRRAKLGSLERSSIRPPGVGLEFNVNGTVGFQLIVHPKRYYESTLWDLPIPSTLIHQLIHPLIHQLIHPTMHLDQYF